ncbi:GNAT family N-acetyltransferase [Candidatus Thorarchaeota archaeon]|nr:MAG: GNAT family N-acetyltransferase [Candidatus Thorarchaeota archaeon]
MVVIRTGKMKDCRDLLTVYQTTRWYHGVRPNGYKTVEQVKDEHRDVGFKRWGWLVAELDGKVVGEIVFRIEKNPSSGKLGIIRNLDIDVRFQKKEIGTQLTRAAEDTLRNRGAVRVVLTTPPEAYNYWMKIGYFARGSLLRISVDLNDVPIDRSRNLERSRLDNEPPISKKFLFSNIAYPGLLVDCIREIIMEGKPGRIVKFNLDSKYAGMGVIYKKNVEVAEFVVDATKFGISELESMTRKTLGLARNWTVEAVSGIVPKGSFSLYQKSAPWSSELAREIPVTRIL